MVDQNPQNYCDLYADVFLKEHVLKETPVSAFLKVFFLVIWQAMFFLSNY